LAPALPLVVPEAAISMARKPHTLDEKPGSMPEIHVTMSSATYIMTPPGIPNRQQLVIRCDTYGNLWMSIQSSEDERDGRRVSP
jgi:hypothetical protein